MKKLFVFDLDGTLLNSQSLILPESIEAMAKLKSLGHYFAIATGRGIGSSQIILDQCQHFDFAICNNGVIVKNLKTGSITMNGHLPLEIFEQFLEIVKATGSQYTVSTSQKVYPISLNNFDYPWMQLQEKMDYDIISWASPNDVRKAIKQGDKITQLAIRNSEEITKQIYQKNLPTIGKQYSTFLTNKVYYDINPLGSDKKVGVKKLLNLLSLTAENLVVFGDSGNDIEMIKLAKYGYAMSNGTESAKAVAKEIIGDHNEATIAAKMYQLK